MKLLKQRKQNRVDRRMALEGVPVLHPGVELDDMPDGNIRVTMTIKRGTGFFERLRPPITRRSYDLDEFGTFVVKLIDGKRTVLDVVNDFEKSFKMSRREVELSIVAFFKLLMQRNVVSVVVPNSKESAPGKTLVTGVLACLVFGLTLSTALSGDSPEETMQEIRSLSDQVGTRIPGSPGNLAIEEMVAKRFAATGLETGGILFTAPIFEPGSLQLDCGEHGTYVLETMHPSLMRPGNFKRNNFETRLVYMGQGEMSDLERMNGVDLKGAIAVMDYDCEDRWMDILRFDFAGVIFAGKEGYLHDQSVAKVYNSEVAVPRFFIDGDEAERLLASLEDSREVAAKATSRPSTWRSGELRDLWVLVPGSDEELSKKTIVFSAPMDANSIVPSRAYGAQRAVNLNVMLELLDRLKQDPPPYSVMFVAVNGHSQFYAGERQLAWHLMAPEEKTEELRDEIASEMRVARLHATEYGKLQLEPISPEDKKDLHIIFEVLWQLEDKQREDRKKAHELALEERERSIERGRKRGEPVAALEEQPMPELDERLDLSRFSKDEIRLAVEEAEEELIDGYRSFFARRGRDPEELEMEKAEDLQLFAELKSLSIDKFLDKAQRVTSAFEDEKLFEKWRTHLDKSTGQRIYVKTRLQDEFKSQVNRVMQDILVVSSTNMTTMSEVDRDAEIARLETKRDDLRKVLVLFNKIDIGVGRSRTYYRQIAVNDTQRIMLKDAVDHYTELYTEWQKLHTETLRRDAAAGAVREALGRRQVALAIALELDAHSRRAGFSYASPNGRSAWYRGLSPVLTNAAASCVLESGFNPYVDALTGDGDRQPAHYFKFPDSCIYYYHSAGETPALAFKSAFADAGELFGPSDTCDKLEPDVVHELQNWTLDFFEVMLRNEELLAPGNIKELKRKDYSWSVLVRTYNLEQFSGKPIPTRPIPGTIVALYEQGRANIDPSIVGGDVVNCYMGLADDTANAIFYGLAERRPMCPAAYKMDDAFIDVLYAVDKGRVQSSKQISSNVSRAMRATVPMFRAREFVIKERRDPTAVASKPIMIRTIWPKKAKGQSDPEKYGVHGAWCLSPAKTHTASGPIGVYLYQRREEMDQDALMVITDTKRCVLNATEENPNGEGFQNQEELGGDILWWASRDMAILNRSRNADMKGVVNQLLDEFLERGERLNDEAAELRAANDHVGYLSKLYEAFGNQVKAYRELQQMNADMLKAVIAYMALMLPFCFFLQKLLFNFKKLEHELAGFSALFFSMFVLFRFIHPAFRMAESPEAIFIAFVLGAIGLFTTGVLHSRFNEEMSILFRGVGGIGEEVSYSTVGSTAMLIGVQNMRRRKVRTTLTTATIVLVVFTMLAFSSVSRKAKPTLLPKLDSAPYTGLFYHWPNGSPVDEDTHNALAELFSGRAELRVRRILKEREPWRMERADDPDKKLEIQAITGLPQNDWVLKDSMALIEGAQFSSPYAAEILLPVKAADALDLSRADVGKAKVKILGREWILKGLIDDQRYKLARDLNPNLPLVPFKADPNKKDDDSLDVEIPNVTDQLMDTAALAIIPEGIASELGAKVRSLSIRFISDDDGGVAIGEELRRVLNVTDAKFYLGSRSEFTLDEDTTVPVKAGIYYVGSSYRTAVGGLAKLIIPLIIAGSIILNTMLGTVYERKSEIAVFNAIGLNPTHIFMFFLAEAIVYSFIGAVGGYLIGQLLTIALKGAGLINDVNINFSSLMVVYAVLFTMTLVILSTLYPGYVATRTAVPSGQRKWSMPENDGQHMSVVFPFIYRARMAYGVMFYIQQFFAPLSDQSMGDLVARLANVDSRDDSAGHPRLSLKYGIALSPYDLGVTQNVTFITQYDDLVKSFRLHMEVDRVSGRDVNWVTTNKPFLERMRKFLIRWRNIDPTRQAWFVSNAIKMFEDGVPPEVTLPPPGSEDRGQKTEDRGRTTEDGSEVAGSMEQGAEKKG